jgi:hypothetical protein
VGRVTIGLEGFEKEAALIAEYFGLDDQHLGHCGRNDVHAITSVDSQARTIAASRHDHDVSRLSSLLRRLPRIVAIETDLSQIQARPPEHCDDDARRTSGSSTGGPDARRR